MTEHSLLMKPFHCMTKHIELTREYKICNFLAPLLVLVYSVFKGICFGRVRQLFEESLIFTNFLFHLCHHCHLPLFLSSDMEE